MKSAGTGKAVEIARIGQQITCEGKVFELVWLTTALAGEWLASSRGNGRRKAAFQSMLRWEIQHGRAAFLNGTTFGFDSTSLVDGHNRLEVIIAMGWEGWVIKTSNLTDLDIGSLDEGTPRSLADLLNGRGGARLGIVPTAEDTANLVSALNLVLRYACERQPPDFLRSNRVRVDMLRKETALPDAVMRSRTVDGAVMSGAIAAAVRYLGSIAHEEATELFLQKVIQNLGITQEFDPAAALHRYLFNAVKNARKMRAHINRWELFRSSIQALNFSVRGLELRTIKLHPRTRIVVDGAPPALIQERLGIELDAALDQEADGI